MTGAWAEAERPNQRVIVGSHGDHDAAAMTISAWSRIFPGRASVDVDGLRIEIEAHTRLISPNQFHLNVEGRRVDTVKGDFGRRTLRGEFDGLPVVVTVASTQWSNLLGATGSAYSLRVGGRRYPMRTLDGRLARSTDDAETTPTPWIPRMSSPRLSTYYAVSLLLGTFVALDPLEWSIQLGIVVLLALGLTIYARRVLHAGAWSRVEIVGVTLMFAAYLPIAWLLGHGPFG